MGACAGSREAWVHCLKGEVRFTPGDGEAEVRPGDLVTLVRKKHA